MGDEQRRNIASHPDPALALAALAGGVAAGGDPGLGPGRSWRWGLPVMVASHALFLVPVFLPNSRFYAPVLSRLPEAGEQRLVDHR